MRDENPDLGEDSYSYMLFAFCSSDSKTEGYKVTHIPAQTYAENKAREDKLDKVKKMIFERYSKIIFNIL